MPTDQYRQQQTIAMVSHLSDTVIVTVQWLWFCVYFFCKEKSRKSKVHTPLDSYLTLGWSDMTSTQKEVMSPPCTCCVWCCSPFWAETVARMRIFIYFAYFLCCCCSWQLLAFGNLPQTHPATQERVEWTVRTTAWMHFYLLPDLRYSFSASHWGHPSIQTVREKLLTRGCFTCSLYLVTGARFWSSPLTPTHLLYRQVSCEPSSEVTEWVPLSRLDAAWGPSLPLAG